MKALTLILFLCGYLGSMAQTWDLISPANERVDYYGFSPAEHFADSNMLWIKNQELNTWNSYDLMLEITGTAAYNDSMMLLTCGSGSYSDGIYRTNVNNGTGEVLFYCYKPQTMVQHQGKYFVGYHGGLISSIEGQVWDSVLSFQTDTAVKYYIENQNNQIAICCAPTGDFVYYSPDDGISWTKRELILPVRDLDYNYAEDKLFLAMGSGSESDGCYVSDDFGITFDPILYAEKISAVKYIDEEHLAIGFSEKPYDPQGVVIVNPTNQEVTDINGNLPTLNIHHFTTHPLINCINLIACTSSGAYISYNILGIETTGIHNGINVYPNPFKKTLTIEGSVIADRQVSCQIFDLSGKLVYSQNKSAGNHHQFKWRIESALSGLSNGCFMMQIASRNQVIFSQMLIKN